MSNEAYVIKWDNSYLLNYKNYEGPIFKENPNNSVIKFFKTKKLAENAINNIKWKYKNATFNIQKVEIILKEII